MREIKFRAWNKTANGWVSNVELKSQGAFMGSTQLGGIIPVGEMVWCQFTGLKDKNGKEIYEGDIVKIMYHYDSYGKNEFEEYRNYTVTWWSEQGSWMMEGSKETFSGATESEVIGNIYENPELI